ncbi:MAG: hypothetical protein ACFHU9_01735 [Fluviicola sp.]
MNSRKRSSIVIAFGFASLVLAFSSCSKPTAEESYALVVSTDEFKDTLLTYRLTQDSLTFTFEQPLHHDCAVAEVILLYPSEEDYKYLNLNFPSKIPGYLGQVPFEGNSFSFTGFELPVENTNSVIVELRYYSKKPGYAVTGEMRFPRYTFRSSKTSEGRMLLHPDIKDLSLTCVDLVALKKMPWEQQKACRDLIEERLKWKLTDLEIEES